MLLNIAKLHNAPIFVHTLTFHSTFNKFYSQQESHITFCFKFSESKKRPKKDNLQQRKRQIIWFNPHLVKMLPQK